MEFDQLNDVYREAILDHRRNPRNHARLDDADITSDGVNPFCGDEIHLQIKLDGRGRVARIGLQGEGCSINQATGSILTEVLDGKTIEQIEAVSDAFQRMMRGDTLSDEELRELGELNELSGVRQFPVRIKCALLAWSTLEEGIGDYRRSHPA